MLQRLKRMFGLMATGTVVNAEVVPAIDADYAYDQVVKVTRGPWEQDPATDALQPGSFISLKTRFGNLLCELTRNEIGYAPDGEGSIPMQRLEAKYTGYVVDHASHMVTGRVKLPTGYVWSLK